MQPTIRSYEELEVWKRGIEFALQTYDTVSHFPMEERFELSSQMRRAAVSIPSNVAEGHARRKPKPFLNHVHISLGSLAELVTCLIIARRRRYVSESAYVAQMGEAEQIGKMLHGLAGSLEQRLEKLGLSLGLAFVVGGLAGVLLF